MKLTLALLIALVALVAISSIVLASSVYPDSIAGYDISWPQCGSAMPGSSSTFVIVGVTHGRAFSYNACFARQHAWATQAVGSAPALYMNLNYPSGSSAANGMMGPAGNCKMQDKNCQAYNYGYNAAQDALQYALAQASSGPTWWLDIETSNSWSSDTSLNAQVIQGALNFLKWHGIRAGIYSTPSQWNKIAGSSFKPGLPNWVSGAPSGWLAPNYCSANYAFGGGVVQLVQYQMKGYDANYACP